MANVTPSVVGTAALDQASGGNPALRLILQQLATAANTQATKTSTSGKGAPNQSSATISFQNPLYIVSFIDPGSTAASLAQAAQQAATASLGANPTQSVIYHQVQAATSVLFDSASNLRLYGGDTGSLQIQFTIADLDVNKSWFFRIRTSFDGVTWNSWKILSKTATAVNVNAVSTYGVTGGSFAAVTMLGKQIIGFGVGQVANGFQIETAAGVTLANSLGIAAPATYTDTGYEVWDVSACNINALGQLTLTYSDTGGHNWSGSANFLTFGWAPGAQNLTEQTLGDGGRWVVVTIPGGCRIAFGSGIVGNGATYDVPAGFTAANSMGVVTPSGAHPGSNPCYGVQQASVVNGLCTFIYADSSGHTWTSSVNFFAIAWEAPLSANLVPVAGGQYLKVPTLSGDVMFGVGSTASGGILPLPSGYTYPKCLAFSTPAGAQLGSLPYAMHGVQLCTIDAGLTTSVGTVDCLYGTVTGLRLGTAAWFSVAWP